MKNGVVIYCRVSTKDQVENMSLSIQERECREAVEKLDCKITKVFIEKGVTGSTLDRPQVAEMLSYCMKNQSKLQYVVVKDLDRFSRDTLTHHVLRSQFRAMGIQLYPLNLPSVADDTAESRFMETMCSGQAQYEREKILERTSKGTLETVLRGGWTNNIPYGYQAMRTADNLPTLSVVLERAKAVQRAFKLYSEGMDLLSVTEKLNALGYKSSRGNKLSFQTVYNWLRNPVYIGKIQHKQLPDGLIDGLHQGIITTDLWSRVQNRINGRRGTPKSKHNPRYPLTTTIRCHECNSPLTGSDSTSKSGKKYAYYHCRSRACKSKNIPKETLENSFQKMLSHVQPTKEYIDHFEKKVIQVWKEEWFRQIEEGRRLDRRHSDLKARKVKIETKFIDEKISDETYRDQLSIVEAELIGVQDAKMELMITEDRIKELLKFTRRFLSSISNSWLNALPERKRVIQRLVFPMGLRCESNGTLQTPELSPLLELIRESKPSNSKVVARRGIEPLFPG